MKKKYPLVSIITPAYRVEYSIADLIKNFSKINYPNYEVIIVFDPCGDKGPEIAIEKTKNKKNWRIIVNKYRLGISKSLNLGIERSKGEYIIFFMTDMFVEPSCLGKLVQFAEKTNSSVGAIAAKTMDFHKRDRIQAYRMYLMPQTGFLYIPEYGLKDSKKYNKPFEGYCGLDAVLFKREVFRKVGLFDDDIDVGINDLDMMWRVWLAGYKVIRIPDVKVYHWSLKEGRATEKWEFSYARMIDVFIQNYSMKYLLIYLPQLIAIYSLRSLITLIQGNPNPLKGWVKAIIWSFFYLPKAIEKRRNIQSNIRVVSDEYLHEKIFGKLSPWAFYKHLRRVQQNITPIMFNEESKDERILTYSK